MNILEKLSLELFGEDFKFRKGQLEVVEKTIENAVNGIKHTVLEAPTGSGKSVIALMTAYALYKLHKKTSYILVSDLSLYKQYENDIAKLNVDCFGSLKGKENYVCWRNGCSVSQASCALKNVPISAIIGSGSNFKCKESCQYMKDYEKAVGSPITLMTYQLYFIQRNYVEDELFGGSNKNFPKRDLVICDECHNICDICQTHFAPRISIRRPDFMKIMDEYSSNSYDERKRASIISSIMRCTSNRDLVSYVEEYEKYVAYYTKMNETLRSALAKKSKLTKSDKAVLAAGNIARQEHCKLSDMLKFISEFKSHDFIVKTADDNEVAVNFIFDSVMLSKYFHMKSECELLMSATVGDFKEFSTLAGLDESSVKFISMPSTFNFQKSPIFFSSANRMSYSEKDVSIRSIIQQVIGICKENAQSRGIVQTGSYANSNALKLSLPDSILDRCIFYNGAREKNVSIQKFKETPGSILVGPTLIEGLDFPDDLCRFIVCIKVPYAFLGSEYVKKKKNFINGWYEYDALMKLCQGIGRGVRNENDWCKTYILDGCVKTLVPKLDRFSSLNGRFVKYEGVH